MATGLLPVGAALPPRRDSLVSAANVAAVNETATSRSDWGDSINVPLARDRMLEYFEREQLPGDVKSTLAAALNGDLHLQSMLFNAMLDTWPKLQKAIDEIGRKVSVAPWKVHPFAKRGEKPTPKAEAAAKEIESLIWGMKPRAARLECGLEDTIKDIVRGYYYGHGVNEIRWFQNQDGEWAPRCTKAVPARFFGYPADYGLQEDPEDRLMFDPEGGMGMRRFVDFPENRFLVAIHRGHGGHPSVSAPLRALTAYWLAAVYGLKWFMNFTQLYGIPWRHAEVGDTKDENAVKAALASIGANGYIVTRPGTKINILAPGSTSAASLPQRELVALADQQCDQFILGQTLTSGVSADGGSRALGEVHQGTLDGVVDGVTDFVGGVLTHQLIPAIAAANYGESLSELPEMWAKREEVKDEKALAERDAKIGITSGKVPVSKAWFYERHGIPTPAAGDELLIDEPEPTQVDPKEPHPWHDQKKNIAAGLVMARYNPNQPRDPGGEDGGRWIKNGGGGPTIDFATGTSGDVKGWLEEQKQQWVDDSMDTMTGKSKTDDGWEILLADESREEFQTEEEADARLQKEREWFEKAVITVDLESASLTDDNGVTIIELTKDEGRWVDANGTEVELEDSGVVEIPDDDKQRLTRFFGGMAADSVKVEPTASGYSFLAETGGAEPYEIRGEIKGDTLKIGIMLPKDKTASFSGSSRGAGLLIQTIDAAETAGLKSIVTQGGKGGKSQMTGYRTWPALGFDVTQGGRGLLKSKLPPEMIGMAGDPPSLLNLTSTKAGRLWWRKNGDVTDLQFDLTLNSSSRARLEQVKKILAR